jgi:hypothetical protein
MNTERTDATATALADLTADELADGMHDHIRNVIDDASMYGDAALIAAAEYLDELSVALDARITYADEPSRLRDQVRWMREEAYLLTLTLARRWLGERGKAPDIGRLWRSTEQFDATTYIASNGAVVHTDG